MILHTINGSLSIKCIWTPRLVRVSSSILTDAFRESVKISEFEWAQVNLVRLWLRVIKLADITDPAVRQIKSWARVCARHLESTVLYPGPDKNYLHFPHTASGANDFALISIQPHHLVSASKQLFHCANPLGHGPTTLM